MYDYYTAMKGIYRVYSSDTVQTAAAYNYTG